MLWIWKATPVLRTVVAADEMLDAAVKSSALQKTVGPLAA
jgi:hypothetical protein